jgi:hypothetical protein
MSDDNNMQTPAEIQAEIVQKQIALAKAQQPLVQAIIDALNDDAFKSKFDAMKTATDQLGTTSTLAVQINNLASIYANVCIIVAREAQGIANTISASTPAA